MTRRNSQPGLSAASSVPEGNPIQPSSAETAQPSGTPLHIQYQVKMLLPDFVKGPGGERIEVLVTKYQDYKVDADFRVKWGIWTPVGAGIFTNHNNPSSTADGSVEELV